MKALPFFLLIFSIFTSCAQEKKTDTQKSLEGLNNTNNNSKIYVDKNFKKTSKDNAAYYMILESKGNQHTYQATATYNDGMVGTVAKTPVLLWLYKYYYLSGELAVSIEGASLESSPKEIVYDGAANWYYKSGRQKAKAYFKLGKLDGDYIEYDEKGNIIATKSYADGEEYKKDRFASNVYRPLVGIWKMEKENNGVTKKMVVNNFLEDGTMVYFTEDYSLDFNSNEWKFSPNEYREKNSFSWKYTPEENNKGIIEYYYKNKLIEKDEITFLSNNTLESVTIFRDPSLGEYSKEKKKFQKSEK